MNSKVNIEVLEALREGSHKAFEKIFVAYYNKIKTFIFGYIKSEADAEELTEDLFVNLWQQRHSINTTKSFNSYLHTIARNAAIDFLRRKFIHETYKAEPHNNIYSSTSEEDLIAKELGLLIDNVVVKMPNLRKKIYILSRKDGLSNSEIAEQLNTTKRNVENQISLALKEIRKAISFFFMTFL